VCAGAEHLASQGKADRARLAIDGGSAGGFTTLGALAFRDTFTAGCSLYGVADLGALAEDTHKFESRYLDGLVGRWPEDKQTYDERAPIQAVDGLSCPILLLQARALAATSLPPPRPTRMPTHQRVPKHCLTHLRVCHHTVSG
jgi:dipeptidyl aminopeptidase/acylaminoacyl peptidase